MVNDKRYNLCLVIPSLTAGGMERVMSELAAYFCNKSNLQVHLVMYGSTIGIFYKIPENLTIHQPAWQFNNALRAAHTLKRMAWLRKTIQKINPATILSFGEYWNSLVLLALYGLKYPVFISDRCQPDKDFGKLHNILRHWLYPRSAGIIAQTEFAKETFFNQFRHKNIKVIGNPIREIKSDIKYPIKKNIVLSVGRLIGTKHHDLLIDIFVKIGLLGWKLIIVGGDAIKQDGMKRLTAKISDLHAEGQVILTGNTSDVDKYYLESKIFAFTSSSEGFPNVIGEALSAGLPAVAFDCVAGPFEMIQDGVNGFLIPLFDNRRFAYSLKKLMVDGNLRETMGINARKSIGKFSVDQIGAEYYNFILR